MAIINKYGGVAAAWRVAIGVTRRRRMRRLAVAGVTARQKRSR